VDELRAEVDVIGRERDHVTQQLANSGRVLCDLERAVSSLHARITPVRVAFCIVCPPHSYATDQLGHRQTVCTSLQTDNDTITS